MDTSKPTDKKPGQLPPFINNRETERLLRNAARRAARKRAARRHTLNLPPL